MDEKQDHVMLKVDTYSLLGNAAIAHIAACHFTMNSISDDCFVAAVDPRSIDRSVFHFDPETIEYWKSFDPEYKKFLKTNPRKLIQVLVDFTSWVSQFKNPCIWTHGSHAHAGQILTAYRILGLAEPAPFYRFHDMLTITSLAGINVNKVKQDQYNNPNDPVAHVKAQADILCRTFKGSIF
jgi:hypothetical protein